MEGEERVFDYGSLGNWLGDVNCMAAKHAYKLSYLREPGSKPL